MITYRKPCTNCGTIKPLTEYPRYRRDKPAVRAQCKPCTNAATREYKATHRKQIAEMDANYYASARATEASSGTHLTGDRTCLRCNVSKPLAEFYRNGWAGRRADCRQCYRERYK